MKLEIKGANELLAKLRKGAKYEDVKNAVKLNGTELNTKMHRNASFKGHYRGNKFIKPTGTTKRSINLAITDGGLAATVAPTTDYSQYLEYGTRFMDSQPFISPSYHSQKPIFLKDLMRLME